MTKLKEIVEAYPDMKFLSADGFDDTLIGVYGEELVYSRVDDEMFNVMSNE